MLFVDIVSSYILAIVLSVFITSVFDVKRKNNGLRAFGIVVFIASWMGGVWIINMGTPVFGYYWLPFLLVALVLCLILLALRRVRLYGSAAPSAGFNAKGQGDERIVFGTVFLIFFCSFLLLVGANYI
jgi:hypothetical protein